ncbi:unnamed protein product [marine sediment metagenome]|uniref:Uncharacterized protein n=1 Tax=marine sediment metagenome TaxID=412755 RepID=X1VUW6_9ZZZZ
MDKVEQNLLIGAFATGAVKLGFEGYFRYAAAKGEPISDHVLYTSFTPYLPSLDDWISLVGVPFLFYAAGKGMKNESLVVMAKGGAIFGASEMIAQTSYRAICATQGQPLRYVLAR